MHSKRIYFKNTFLLSLECVVQNVSFLTNLQRIWAWPGFWTWPDSTLPGSIHGSGLGSCRSISRVGLHTPGLQPDWALPHCWKGSQAPTVKPRLPALEVWKRLFGSTGQAYATSKAQAVCRVSPVPGHRLAVKLKEQTGKKVLDFLFYKSLP